MDSVTPESQKTFFEDYFRGAHYVAWDDLAPPAVRVSDDGSMAWIVSRLRVERTAPGADGKPQERVFVYAGIMTYERRDGRWVRTAKRVHLRVAAGGDRP